MRNRYFGFLLASSCLVFMAIGLKADHSEGPTVQVSVQASDTSGGTLHYSWRSTDGQIVDVNSPTTSWTLPTGPGIHFAYVLVSNGLGGYTERRLALNTDTIGRESEGDDDTNPLNRVSSGPGGRTERRLALNADTTGTESDDDDETGSMNKYVAPPAPAQVGDYYRSWVQSTVGANASDAMLDSATTSYLTFSNFSGPPDLVGTFTLADGSICGTQNEFFDVHVSAMATLVDASNHLLYGPVPVNKYQD